MFENCARFAVLSGLLAVALASSTASAALVNYDLQWSGVTFGNGVTATGRITLDTAAIEASFNPGAYDAGPFAEQAGGTGSPFSNFVITIFGSTGNDGTYTSAGGDFDGLFWEVGGGGVDLSTELIGQSDFKDFNIFSSFDGPLLPFEKFVVVVGGETEVPFEPIGGPIGIDPVGSSQEIRLASFRPSVVPEPSSMLMFSVIGIATGLRRRRRSTNEKQT